jgi:TP53 regulating kinase-like protein
MKLIKQGAEAKLFLDKLDDQNVIIKERVKKNYRIKQIDEKIRITRTTQEYNLLSQARRSGVPTPKIFEIDKKNHKIIMEYIDGIRIKELLDQVDEKKIEEISFEIGRLIGKLHSVGIIHGDLTLSNILSSPEGCIFLDFGLSEKSFEEEMFAEDLNLLKNSLNEIVKDEKSSPFEKILDTYSKRVGSSYEKTKHRIQEISRRGRYIDRGSLNE